MQQSSSPLIGVLLIGAFVAISILVRRGRLQSRSSNLAAKERIRPLAITLLDPVISVVIIGPFVWHFISHSTTHLFVAIVGGAFGIAIGYARARVMFVRAIRETKSIVLRRSGLEYGLVVILVILRSAQGSVERSSSGAAQSLVTALAGLALVEAVARSGFIVKRYVDSPATSAAQSVETDPPSSSIEKPR
jgi:hypothetical protein